MLASPMLARRSMGFIESESGVAVRSGVGGGAGIEEFGMEARVLRSLECKRIGVY